jgi:hypothetical protein
MLEGASLTKTDAAATFESERLTLQYTDAAAEDFPSRLVGVHPQPLSSALYHRKRGTFA